MSDLKTQLSAYLDAVVERVEEHDIPRSDALHLQPAKSRRVRQGWVLALGAAAVVIVLGALSLWVFPGEPSAPAPADTAPTTPGTTGPPATTTPDGLQGLPALVLGIEHVWPETPSDLSPVELARLFARDALGWESPGATEFTNADADGSVWLHIQQPGVEELVDVLTVLSPDGGRVIVEVGTPWERGVNLQPSDAGGTTVTLLRIADAVAGEVALRLTDGRQVSGATPIDMASSDPIRVDFPNVDPDVIASTLVRYVNDDGTVIATTGVSRGLGSANDQSEAARREALQRAAERQKALDEAQDVEPITGYGDFSDVEYFHVDWYEVTRLQIQCLRDQGFAVEAIPPGDGIDFSDVPSTDHEAAERTLWACLAGLNLPEPTEPTDEQLEERYNYLIHVKECVETEGYKTTDPPSLDTFIETGGMWSPYDLVSQDDTISMQDWNALNVACPQNPSNP